MLFSVFSLECLLKCVPSWMVYWLVHTTHTCLLIGKQCNRMWSKADANDVHGEYTNGENT